MTDDPNVERFRAELAAQDRTVLDAVNARLRLVAELKRYKDEHGIAFVDPDRERSMIDARSDENQGPLSDAGVREFYVELLALTKRELES